MRIFADLHSHGRWARATSRDLSIENLERWARTKGVNLLGSGDFTHPTWLKELKMRLKETHQGAGIFQTASGFHFILQAEVSNIFEHEGRAKKVHNLLFAPSFEVVEQINEALAKKGDLASDGRPVLSDYTCAQLVEDMRKISPKIVVVPAHAWTPWFSVFGSSSGFDSLEECFKEQAKHIFAIETGLSSDPPMNWRLRQLDRIALLSNSDLHSAWPWRLGREANVFELPKLSYDELFDAIRTKDQKRFLFTIEVDPGYGKYHFDGHRACGLSFEPDKAKEMRNRCPNCGRRLTIGVQHRVDDLADRPAGFVPSDAIPFKSLLPLHELLAKLLNAEVASQRVWREYNKLIAAFGNEFSVLLESPLEELTKVSGRGIAEIIIRNRLGQIKVKPGYDGVYGEPVFGEEEEKTVMAQKSLKQFLVAAQAR